MVGHEDYQQVSRKRAPYTDIKQILITAIQWDAIRIFRGPDAEKLSQFFHYHDQQCRKRPHPPRYITMDAIFDVLLTVHLSIILVINQLNAQILVL